MVTFKQLQLFGILNRPAYQPVNQRLHLGRGSKVERVRNEKLKSPMRNEVQLIWGNYPFHCARKTSFSNYPFHLALSLIIQINLSVTSRVFFSARTTPLRVAADQCMAVKLKRMGCGSAALLPIYPILLLPSYIRTSCKEGASSCRWYLIRIHSRRSTCR